jgi:hypothetical protein
MTPRTSPRKAYNTLPHSVVGLYAVEPMRIFGLFLTPEILKTYKGQRQRCDCGHMPVHGEKMAVCW